MKSKQRIFSGVQPSGNLHIGNYLGAIKNWVQLQEQYESIFCVVDMHAITVPQDPETLRKKTLEIAKIYLAAGIDPAKSAIFVQSQVPQHAELMWTLNTVSRMSDLLRMTQFKDKTGVDMEEFESAVREHAKKEISDILKKEQLDSFEKIEQQKALTIMHNVAVNTAMDTYRRFVLEPLNKVGVGLFDYPVLMAADILLYGTQVVPVGEDQKQHVELARDLAKRFNQKFGETFTVPQVHIREEGMRVMGLDDPTKKMSKSAASEYNYIALTDDADTVRRKIKKAVTDSGSEIVYRDDKPALKNLINIYCSFAGVTPQEVEKKFAGKGYGDFKTELAEVVIGFLVPFQARLEELSDEKVLAILHSGREKVERLAAEKMAEVKKKVGFVL